MKKLLYILITCLLLISGIGYYWLIENPELSTGTTDTSTTLPNQECEPIFLHKAVDKAPKQKRYTENEPRPQNGPNPSKFFTPRPLKPLHTYRLGFTGLMPNLCTSCSIEGSIPEWLRGTLFLVGPGQFILDDSRARHWLDGLAMLHEFSIQENRVCYQNRLLKTNHYKKVQERGSLQLPPPIAGDSFLSKCLSAMSSSSQSQYDNTNINVISINSNHLIACTETPYHWCIHTKHAPRCTAIEYSDRIKGHHTTAHPRYDSKTHSWVNVMVQYASTSTYKIYTTDFKTQKRTVIWSKKIAEPSYMHSFAMTPDYIVLIEPPFVINPIDLLYNNKPFIQHFQWKPEQGTRFTVIDRATGQTIQEQVTPAFFYLHTIHAYQDKEKLHIDLVAYDSPTFMDTNYQLKNIFQSHAQKWPQGTIHRYTIDLKHEKIQKNTQLNSHHCIMPTINSDYIKNDKSYQYLYGKKSKDNHDFYNQLVKIDIVNGKELVWHQAGCYTGEPILVKNPHATTEDDAVILSVVLDTVAGNSFVLILDAKTLTEIARATTSHHIPFTVHGIFCKS